MLNRLTDLLEISLGCSVVIALLLLLTPVLSRHFSPRLQYWAWALLAVRLLLPGMPLGENTVSAPIRVEAPQTITAPAYDGMTQDIKDALPHGYRGDVVGSTTVHVWYSDDQNNSIRAYDNPIFRLEAYNNNWSVSFHWEGVWKLGLILCLGWQLFSYLAFVRRIRRWSAPATAGDLAALNAQQLAVGKFRRVSLVRCELVSSPLLMGFIKPTIVLPAQLPEHTLGPSLAHELTHLKRGDLWYQLLLRIAHCVHWFNPLVWLMVRQAKRDMELCCDYDLLQSQSEETRRAYGQAILDQMTAGRGVSPLTTGFSGDKKGIFTRFKAIMDTSPKKKGTAVLVLILCAAALAGTLVSCNAAPGSTSVTVSLKDQPEQSVTALYCPDGLQGSLSELPTLITYSAQDTLVITLPRDMNTSFIRGASSYYLGGTVHSYFHELSPDWNGQVTIPIDLEEWNYLEVSLTGEDESQTKYEYAFRVTFPEVTASLSSDPAEQISVNYYEEGFDWNYNSLPTLVTGEDSDAILLSLPEDLDPSELLISEDHYRSDSVYEPDRKNMIERRDPIPTYLAEEHAISLPVSRTNPGAEEESVFFLTWGENSRFRYVFRVEFSSPVPAVTAYLGDLEEEAVSAAYYPNGFQGSDFNALPTLYAASDEIRLTIQLPDGITGPVYLGQTPYSGTGILDTVPEVEFNELKLGSLDDSYRYSPNTSFSLSLLGLKTGFKNIVFYLTWGEDNPFVYVFQVAAMPAPELTLTDVFDSYVSDSFSVSATEYDGLPYYKFENTPAAISILMPEQCQTDPSIISYRGRTMTAILPCNPLSGCKYGNAGGRAYFVTADLTGDGSDELVYVWGYGGTGLWEDRCKVFDLTTMEELPVSMQDEELPAHYIQAELVAYDSETDREHTAIFRLTTGDGDTVYASTAAQNTAQQPGPAKLRFDGHTHLTVEETQLKITLAISPDNIDTFTPTLSYLGEVSGSLSYSPSLRAFTLSPPFAVNVFNPIDYQP